MTLTGKVTRLVADKGFGFLAGPQGVEYFFHRSAAPDFDLFREGMTVTFEEGHGTKGPRAENVARG